ncbi:glycoside hydrolase family protein [Nakamurella lactea]|uniref:hypothetical protein n=1 Tax=Nakamurella lactea TaxID=459515 RepID=UPI0012B5A74E|nr:hypothetical protein [Nakamurella lactea]
MAMALAGTTAVTGAAASTASGFQPAPSFLDAEHPVDLPNPSFEDSATGGLPTDWSLDPLPRAQTASVSSDFAHDGASSVRIENAAGSAIALRSTAVAAVPAANYTLTSWYRSQSGAPAYVYLEFLNATGGRLTEVHVIPAAAAEWTQVSLTATAPTGAVSLDVLLYGSGSTEGISYHDAVALTSDAPPPVEYDPNIGTNKQLFVDNYRVAATDKVSTLVHQATKQGRVLSPDQPWESNNAYLYGSAVYDSAAHRYKMWYQAYNRDLAQYFVCYATSRDGIHWDKPSLGIVEFDGSTANNIVGTMHSPTVILDTNATDPARKYKMFGVQYGSGYWVWFSPDGLHWTPSTLNPVLPDADVANVTYDAISQRYMVTSKHPDPSGRAAFVSFSDDFEHWTDPVLTLRGDERDQALAEANGVLNSQIYGMPVASYEGVYVGFPWIFQYGGAGAPGTAGDGTIDTEIAFSRDARTWTRDDRTVVIPRGVEGSFDSGMIFTAGNLIVRGDRVLMYYGGWDGTHGSATRGAAVGLASWRLDGFVSMSNGGDQVGTVTTKPLVFDGKTLHVNSDFTGRGHQLRVQLLDADGTVIPGFEVDKSIPITGNRTDVRVRWRGNPDLGSFAGSTVQLKFYLDGGDLYAYQFER